MIKARVLLVGYPRSGTTLLQSLIATQPAIASFPESHFLERTLLQPARLRYLRWGLVSPAIHRELRGRLATFLAKLGDDRPKAQLPRYRIWLNDYMQGFVQLLDTLTLTQGKAIWIEKTPAHLYHIDRWERYVRGVKFIHLIRRGADAISSRYAVACHYPNDWEQHPIEVLVANWQQAIQLTLRQQYKPNHLLLRYESLVDDPPATLQQVCNFIGTPFQAERLQHYPEQAAALSLPHEPWKAGVQQPIVNRNDTHFEQLFTEAQRAAIVQAVAPLEQRLERLPARA